MKTEAINRPPSLVEIMCERLAAIVRGAPGEWLPTERELSAQFGVSRNVVREATKRLEAQGLLEVQHGIGIKVVNRLHRPLSDSLALLIPDISDRLAQLNETRLSIEPDSAALAAERATEAQLATLCRIQTQLENASDHNAAIEADIAAHRAIADASGNLIYRLILDSLAELGIASRLLTIGRIGKQTAVEHHSAILEAIVRRDAEGARAAMRSHILAAGQDMDLPALKTKKAK